MNKQKLLSVLEKFPQLTEKELSGLEELVDDHPYFQVGHTLIAKAYKDLEHNSASEKLGLAAIYAVDRSILKDLMGEEAIINRPEPVEVIETVVEEKTEEVKVEKESEPEIEVIPEQEPEIAEAIIEPETEIIQETETHHEPEDTSELIIPTETKQDSKIEVSVTDDDNPIYKELQETLNTLRSRRHFLDEDNETVKPIAKEEPKKTVPKKTTAKKATPKKVVAKKEIVKKPPVKKVTTTKKAASSTAKKTTAAKKTATKKTTTSTKTTAASKKKAR